MKINFNDLAKSDTNFMKWAQEFFDLWGKRFFPPPPTHSVFTAGSFKMDATKGAAPEQVEEALYKLIITCWGATPELPSDDNFKNCPIARVKKEYVSLLIVGIDDPLPMYIIKVAIEDEKTAKSNQSIDYTPHIMSWDERGKWFWPLK